MFWILPPTRAPYVIMHLYPQPGVQKSFDVLPSWADPGSCAPSAYVMIFWTVATNAVNRVSGGGKKLFLASLENRRTSRLENRRTSQLENRRTSPYLPSFPCLPCSPRAPIRDGRMERPLHPWLGGANMNRVQNLFGINLAYNKLTKLRWCIHVYM